MTSILTQMTHLRKNRRHESNCARLFGACFYYVVEKIKWRTHFMALPIDLWLIHPNSEMCDAFRDRFTGLPNVRVIQSRFEDLEPHDCFVTAANSFGIMNAGIDAAVIRVHGPQLMTRIQHRIRNEFLGEQPIGTTIIEPTGNADYPFIAH